MILTFDHHAIRELRLNHPPVNALSPQLITELARLVTAAPGDGAQALVLSGSPGRFSGGLDVPALLALDRLAIDAVWRDFYGLLGTLACSPIPIVAAITGHAPAGGTVLPLFCDWRIAAEGDWKIGLNEVPVGIPLPPVILAALRYVVGPRRAEWLAVAGSLISPAQALEVGLVDELAPPDQVVDKAIRWCESILSLPPQAVAITRRNARADLTALFGSALERELAVVSAYWSSEETQAVLRRVMEELARKKLSKPATQKGF